jgi:hypothetical protein
VDCKGNEISPRRLSVRSRSKDRSIDRNSIKMALKEVCCDGLDRMYLAQERDELL